MKNVIKKAIPLSLTLSMMASVPAYAYEKSETVYTKADENGHITYMNVSEHLKSDKKETIEDRSNLKDIKNVSGKEKYTKDGSYITWKSTGKDIFYNGTTDKELPVSVDVTYKLNGKTVKPSEAKGRKGHVKVVLQYTNNDAHEYGGDTIYTPFIVLTGMSLDASSNKNVTVTNGKVIKNGEKDMVVGMAAPGLSESFNLSGYDDSDRIEISYDTTDFNASSIYSAFSAQLLDGDDLNNAFGKLEGSFDSVDALTSAMSQLVDGSQKLAKGADTLADGTKKLDKGAQKLDTGVGALHTGAHTFNEKMNLANKGAATLQTKGKDLTSGTKKLATGVKQLYDSTVTNKSIEKLNGALGQLAAGSKQMSSGIEQLTDGVDKLDPAEKKLSAGKTSLSTGDQAFKENAKKINAGSAQVEGGLETLVFQAAAYSTLKNSGEMDKLSKQTVEALDQIAQLKAADANYKVYMGLAQSLQGYKDTFKSKISEAESDINAAEKKKESAEAKISATKAKISALSSEKAKANKVIEECTEKMNAEDVDEETKATYQAQIDAAQASITTIDGTISDLNASMGNLDDAVKAAGEAIAQARSTIKELEGAQTKIDSMIDDAKNKAGRDVNADAKIAQIEAGLKQGSEKISKQLSDTEAAVKAAYNADPTNAKFAQINALKQYIAGVKALTDAYTKEGGLSDGLNNYMDGVTKYVAGVNQLETGITTLAQKATPLINGLSQLGEASSSLTTLTQGITVLYNGSKDLNDGVEKYVAGVNTLTNGVDQLTNGFAKILKGTSDLKKGTDTLADGTKELNTGALKLSDGANTLASGISKFKSQGIDRITGVLNTVKNDTDKLDIMMTYAQDYRYTKTNNDCKYETKFIYIIEE